MVVLLAVPLVVALAAVAEPRWYPAVDLAQTELRVRDVLTGHPPLLGLGGRIGQVGSDQGSHPGPLSFYVLAPAYGLFGRSSWALQVAGVSLHLLAVGALAWLVARRRSVGLALGLAAVVAVVAHAFGTAVLTEPWNPYLPVLWWLVLLTSVWAVVSGDPPALPVAAFAGSLCAQTHIPYAGVVAGAGLVVAGAVLFGLLGRLGPPRRRWVAWGLAAVVVALVVWAPPAVEQLQGGRGNLSVILDYFGDPGEALLGGREGVELLLRRLDPVALVRGTTPTTGLPSGGPALPGALLLAAWAGSVLVAWRARLGDVLRLHVVLGVTLVVAAVSLSRVVGIPWNYLSLWVWVLAALLAFAIGWTAAAALGPRLPAGARRAGGVALGGTVLLFAGLLLADGVGQEAPDLRLSEVLAGVVPGTVERLGDGGVPGGGRDGRYLVAWTDPVDRGFGAFGLVDELERAGFAVGLRPIFEVAVREHRLVEPGEATAEVHWAVGPAIDTWRARADAVEVAYVDPRTEAERARYDELRADVVTALEDGGLDDLAARVDDLSTVGSDPRVFAGVSFKLQEMSVIGQPTAIFVAPPPAD